MLHNQDKLINGVTNVTRLDDDVKVGSGLLVAQGRVSGVQASVAGITAGVACAVGTSGTAVVHA